MERFYNMSELCDERFFLFDRQQIDISFTQGVHPLHNDFSFNTQRFPLIHNDFCFYTVRVHSP